MLKLNDCISEQFAADEITDDIFIKTGQDLSLRVIKFTLSQFKTFNEKTAVKLINGVQFRSHIGF